MRQGIRWPKSMVKWSPALSNGVAPGALPATRGSGRHAQPPSRTRLAASHTLADA